MKVFWSFCSVGWEVEMYYVIAGVRRVHNLFSIVCGPRIVLYVKVSKLRVPAKSNDFAGQQTIIELNCTCLLPLATLTKWGITYKQTDFHRIVCTGM